LQSNINILPTFLHCCLTLYTYTRTEKIPRVSHLGRVVQRTEFEVGNSQVSVGSTADLNYLFTVHTVPQVVDFQGDGQVLYCLLINLSNIRADYQATSLYDWKVAHMQLMIPRIYYIFL
jgi:hypothetical protein